jgi:GxxExxY protein
MIVEEELTGQIIKVFYKVYNTLGYGFIEPVYHNSMIIELAARGLRIESEKPIGVHYEGKLVGSFSADLVVEEKVILELKAKENIHDAHIAQLTNYLRSTNIEVGMVLNFGRRPEFKRKYFPNSNKHKPEDPESDLLDALIS